MRITEIKIDNILRYKKGHLAIVKGIHSSKDTGVTYVDVIGVNSNYIDGTYELSNFYPVDLHEFYIPKVVFALNEQQAYQYEVFENSFGFFFVIDIYTDLDERDIRVKKNVKYIHELQNIYSIFSDEILEFTNLPSQL